MIETTVKKSDQEGSGTEEMSPEINSNNTCSVHCGVH